MTDTTVAKDDARQATQHEAVKSQVEGHVNAEIAGEAAVASPEGQARVVEVAAQLRDKAVDETVKGERAVERGRVAARGSQFLDYAFYVVYSLLGIRLVLALIAANSSNGFVKLVRAVTDPFYAPFRGIVPSPSAEGGYTLVVPILIALVVYALVHAAINGMLRMVAQRKTTI
jgi:uncharacterized protein YggT (Ycf19 family)